MTGSRLSRAGRTRKIRQRRDRSRLWRANDVCPHRHRESVQWHVERASIRSEKPITGGAESWPANGDGSRNHMPVGNLNLRVGKDRWFRARTIYLPREIRREFEGVLRLTTSHTTLCNFGI
jgi:hypothetical protein